MACEASDLIESARKLLDPGSGEAETRTVISRAYYGAYHTAKHYHDALPAPGSVRNESGSHKQLISQLRYPTCAGPEKTRSVALGNLLLSAFALRVTADYKLEDSCPWGDAREALSKADQILAGTPKS